MDDLRLGHREPKPARLHRHVPWRLSDSGIPKLAGWIPPRRVPRHVHRYSAHPDGEIDRAHQKQLQLDENTEGAARSPARAKREARKKTPGRCPSGSPYSVI